jgi:iron complex transport system permease protein
LLVWVLGYLLSPKLDYLALGDIRAKLLGVDPNQIRCRAFFLIAISIGAITSIFGQISFLALAIPHISRALFSYRNRAAMLASGLIGALTLVLADLAARTLASPNELPIGLVTALIGSPVLIYSVKKWTSKNA